MTTNQFNQAVLLIKSEKDFSGVDDSILHGCGLYGFERVTVTLEVAASMIRHYAMQFNGEFDAHALNEIKAILKNTCLICDCP